MNGSEQELARLVQTVRTSRKYGAISPEFVAAVGAIELEKRRTWREAVKSTKSRLHQVAGAYLGSKMDYPAWLDLIRRSSGDPVAQRSVALEIMANHASTRERLPFMEEFYQVLFTGLSPLVSVMDLACGLNPLALPWMPISGQTTYHACDIYEDQIDFLNGYFQYLDVRGQAQICDLVFGASPLEADLVLLLKTVPCLEQIDRSAGVRLLDRIVARYLIVSYPVRSLGGHCKGMLSNYTEHFNGLARERRWQVERFEFPSELVFRIEQRQPTVD